MRRFALLLVLLAGCQSAAPPVPPPPPPPFSATGTAQRVVLMSLDGLGADALARNADLPTFARMAAEGMHVERVITVNPTVTSSAHVSIITGKTPQQTGIVANYFHVPGTPPEQIATGFDTTIDVETIVEAARRQGKRVGSVAYPTTDGTTARRTADFGLNYTKGATKARLIRLSRADFHAEWVPPTWTRRPQRRASFSPVMRSRIEWAVPKRARADVDLFAYDTTDDAVRNYDLLLIEVDGDEIALDEKRWFAIARRLDDGVYGSWSKILRFDPTLESVTLYWGAIAHNEAYPASYRDMLDAEVGFWPSPPSDGLALESLAGGDGIDPDTFIEQNDRMNTFLARAAAVTIRRMPFDLLLAYEPTVDSAEHTFDLMLDTQTLATPANRAAGERARRAAFVAVDKTIAMVAATLDPARDAFVVTGDHGLGPVDVEVRINRLLAEKGFAPRWRAFSSGSIANLYRFGEPDDTEPLVKMLTDTRYFESITRKTAQSHRNSGDVVAFAYPTIYLNPIDEGPSVLQPRSPGQHGGLNTHPHLHTTLFAWGAGVRHAVVPRIEQTEIAGYVAQLLGISF